MSTRKSKSDRTKEALGEAVISLLNEQAYESITAEDIAERAGMGRATWFRHFSSKGEAIAYALAARAERWMEEGTLDRNPETALLDPLPFLTFMFEARDTVSLLLRNGVYPVILDAFVRSAKAFLCTERELSWQENFYVYGYLGILDKWVKSSFSEPPEQVAQEVSSILARQA